VDCCQPGVAGPHAVAPAGLEVLQERPDHASVEVLQLELGWRRPGAFVNEVEQEPKGVPIADNGVGAGVALSHEPVGEKRLERRRQAGHGCSPPVLSRRWAARARSSGAPDKYQYVWAGTSGSQNCS
jgi:hypothetical protein